MCHTSYPCHVEAEETSRFSLRPNVVNFKNHLDKLSCQTYLLLLANQSFYYVLFFHICKNEIEGISIKQITSTCTTSFHNYQHIVGGGGGGGGGIDNGKNLQLRHFVLNSKSSISPAAPDPATPSPASLFQLPLPPVISPVWRFNFLITLPSSSPPLFPLPPPPPPPPPHPCKNELLNSTKTLTSPI